MASELKVLARVDIGAFHQKGQHVARDVISRVMKDATEDQWVAILSTGRWVKNPDTHRMLLVSEWPTEASSSSSAEELHREQH
jgi:hypothetical protein